MAEQKVQHESIVKSFTNLQFAKMEDKYDVKLEFDGSSGSISLQFMNKTNTKTYHQLFTKESINEITSRCQLSAENLSQLIIDPLSSSEFIEKFCRIFIFAFNLRIIDPIMIQHVAKEKPLKSRISCIYKEE